MKTVFDIANWFLGKNSLTLKKLEKLCYYSQAWYCALYDGSPLFPEKIEAWVHGPAIPELRKKYLDYEWEPIPKYNSILSFSGKEMAILEAVFETYWAFDGDQLEKVTRLETPWRNARDGFEPWEICTNEITIQSMRDFYLVQYEKYRKDDN